MKRPLGVLLLALVATSLLVATSGADVVSVEETDVLELEPAGEGAYTQVGDDGEIRIVLTKDNPNVAGGGVNADAVTDVGAVFTVENVLEQSSDASVWIEDDSAAVTFTDGSGSPVDDESEAVELAPGERLTVHMQVDTRGTDEVAVDGIRVLATLDPPVDSANEGGGVGGSGGDTDGSDGGGSSSGGGGPVADGTGAQSTDDGEQTATPTPATTPIPTESPTQLNGTAGPGSGQETPADDDPPAEVAGLSLVPLVVLVVAALGLLTVAGVYRSRDWYQE